LKLFKHFLILFICAVFPVLAQDDTPYDWQDIDRLGLYGRGDDRQIVRDIWDDYSQNHAVLLLDRLPNTLQSPAYRELAQRLLLSTASKSREDIDAPLLLAKRLEKLITLGLFDEAKDLMARLDEQFSDRPDDYHLDMIALKLSLIDGDLPAVCLDIRAAAAQYRDLPGWRDLADFCRLRYDNNGQKLSLRDIDFKTMPELKTVLISDSVDMDDLHSPLPLLIAFADQRLSQKSYVRQAKNIQDLPDLAVKLALNERYKTESTYLCYVIEAAQRGLINATELEDFYQQAPFSDDMLAAQNGEIALHPCHVPAYFYQRLARADNDDQRKSLTNIMLHATDPIRFYALIPLQSNIIQYADAENAWKANLIAGLMSHHDEQIALPESIIIPPLESLASQEMIRKKDYKNWFSDQNNRWLLKNRNIDPALLVYFSQTISERNANFKRFIEKSQYENLFSLTYAKKSLSLGLGYDDFIASAYDKNNHASVIVHILNRSGSYPVEMLDLQAITVILSALNAYKLDKEKLAIAFEYLH